MSVDRWTISKTSAWYAAQPWICGFNFLPSTAVNFLEMWHTDTFDAATIEQELQWASDIGFNALRTNLNFLVWKHDRNGFFQRLEWMLAIADRLGIKTVPCLFDDCGFGGAEPEYGRQPDPVPGVHNSRAIANPGRAAVNDRSRWHQFETYVRDVVRSFAADSRVLFWDLYNEPGNRMVFEADGYRVYETDTSGASLELMVDSFRWSRAELPSQPLTVGAWTTPVAGSQDTPYSTYIDRMALSLSDIVTFHAYSNVKNVRTFIYHLEAQSRPMICTEWMARGVGSRIDDQLAMFRQSGIGCFQWGLVAGRSQTKLPWPSDLVEAHGGMVDDGEWFQDLLRPSGDPYRGEETDKIGALVRQT